MRGFDPNTPRDCVVKDEQGLSLTQQTVFKIKNLTVREVERLKNTLFAKHGLGENAVEKLLIGSQERQALEMGLVGWENFLDQEDNPIPFSQRNFDYIPAKYRAEIALEIRGEAELSEDEVKN